MTGEACPYILTYVYGKCINSNSICTYVSFFWEALQKYRSPRFM